MKIFREHAAVKSISWIVLTLLIFFAAVSVIGYNGFTDALLSQYSDGAFLIADTAAKMIDADKIEEYMQMDPARVNELLNMDPDQQEEAIRQLSGDDETLRGYMNIWLQMDQLCNSSGSTFIYVIQPDRRDYAHITIVSSTINHNSNYTRYDFGYVRETTNDEYKEKYAALYDQTAERELLVRDQGYIETDPHITAMIGLRGKHDGQLKAILCVQRQMDVMGNARQVYLKKIILALIILLLSAIAGQAIFLHRTLLQPVKLISDEAIRFSKDSRKSEKTLHERIRNRDEIGKLADSIDLMEEQIEDYILSITGITAEKERIKTELNLATRIQADMLPHVFPPFPDRHEFGLFADMDPAKEVGGDFYDFFLIDDDHLCLVMADVSGKGIPAALFMMASKILLQNNAMLGKTPAEILADVNNSVCANNREQMFVTVWLGILEISTGKLTAANAGHEYPRADAGGRRI